MDFLKAIGALGSVANAGSSIGEPDIVELTSSMPLRDKLIETVSDIYLASFPAEERLAVEELFDSIGGRRIIIAHRNGDGNALGFATLLPIPKHSACLLEYIAVNHHQRSAGLGARLLQQAADVARSAGAAHLFMELERPSSDDASHPAARRVRFYQRQGCRQVAWLNDYSIPDSRDPSVKIPMLLYVKELIGSPPEYDARDLVSAIFDVAYGGMGQEVLPELLQLISPSSDPRGAATSEA